MLKKKKPAVLLNNRDFMSKLILKFNINKFSSLMENGISFLPKIEVRDIFLQDLNGIIAVVKKKDEEKSSPFSSKLFNSS